jgi:hypothetical protein
MAWVRLDDQVPQHPKVLRAGPSASWLWVCGIAYCSRHLTDGIIPAEALSTFGVPGARRLAARLVEIGLWHRAGSGFQVHDYHAYNDHAEDVKARRKATASRVARWKQERAGNSVTSALPERSNIESGTREECDGNAPPTPVQYQVPPISPPRGAGLSRPYQLRKRAEDLRTRAWGRCRHDPTCDTYDACILKIAEDLRTAEIEALNEGATA